MSAVRFFGRNLRDRDELADVIGWALMLGLGIAFLASLAYKVNHARERDIVGQAMLNAYMVQHKCVLAARPVQNQPQMVRCDNGQTTEHQLRKKVVGGAWL